MTHAYTMHQYPPLLFAWTARLFAYLLAAAVPHEVWSAIEGLLDVPDTVKVFINPLLGSICITMVEAFTDYLKRRNDPSRPIPDEPFWILPAKVFVGWVVGGVSIPLFTPFIKASEPTIAFFAGAAGTTFLKVYVANLLKKFDNNSTDDDNKQTP